MLVLSRKPGQELMIGDDVTVSVVRVHGNRVQLGIVAPPDLRIQREEVRSRILGERRRLLLQSDLHK